MQKPGSSQVKQLRELDLATLEKPKTLLILHYNGRRISVPLFKELYNTAELLYHHIATLEQTVLSLDPNWEKKASAQIVCFQMKKDVKTYDGKISDGDLKGDIILSLMRIEGEASLA